MRVLRAGRIVGAGRHHRADQGGGEPDARDRRHPAHHVRSAKQSLQRGVEPAHRRISATRCSAPSFRATCGSPRRRRSASRCCCTTRIRAARWPISRWPARCCARKTTQAERSRSRQAAAKRRRTGSFRANQLAPLQSQTGAAPGAGSVNIPGHGQETGLGRGLEPARPGQAGPSPGSTRRRRASCPVTTSRIYRSTCSNAAVTSRASTCARKSLEELADSIKTQGVIQPIVVRPLDRRTRRLPALRNHRRRAPLARREDRGSRHHSGRRPARTRRRRHRHRAHREHPARKPQSARRSARARPAHQRIRHHAPAGRRCRRSLARRGSQPAAVARAAAGSRDLVEKRAAGDGSRPRACSA